MPYPSKLEKKVPHRSSWTKKLNLQRTVRYHWIKLLRIKGDPFVLARGIFIGILVGLTPTIPFHTILILIGCTLFRGHILAAIGISYLASNPLTIPLHYYAAWKIGTMLSPGTISWMQLKSLLASMEEAGIINGFRILSSSSIRMLWPVFTGGILLAVPFAVGGYFSALYIYTNQQKKKLDRFRHESINGQNKISNLP